MLAGLFGGLIFAAILVILDVRRTRKLLLRTDLSSVLVSADKYLDDPIRERLFDGTILLLRCDWLNNPASDEKLGSDPVSGNPIIKRRQDMPAEAYYLPEEAEALFSQGTRSVLVLSYGWATGPHSDPSGHTLQMVRKYLQSDPTTHSCGLFWDIASRPQPEQTDDEVEIGNKALEVMSSFYASVSGTAVIQQKHIPPRPPQYDGWIQLFGVEFTARKSGAALRRQQSVGSVLESARMLKRLGHSGGGGGGSAAAPRLLRLGSSGRFKGLGSSVRLKMRSAWRTIAAEAINSQADQEAVKKELSRYGEV